jgi:hypothetical protein
VGLVILVEGLTTQVWGFAVALAIQEEAFHSAGLEAAIHPATVFVALSMPGVDSAAVVQKAIMASEP